MRYFATHDSEGRIRGIFGCPEDAPPLRQGKLDAGLQTTEIDVPDDAIDPGNLATMLDYAKTYRIDMSNARPASVVRTTEE
ncbi:hypothetical protein [Nocardia sp. NPDC050406]|uniref:hypothetical protein n=1 Tax=Nocardia sp. NPDC050406 TaxID=3364318 RepID=UPI0037A14260